MRSVEIVRSLTNGFNSSNLRRSCFARFILKIRAPRHTRCKSGDTAAINFSSTMNGKLAWLSLSVIVNFLKNNVECFISCTFSSSQKKPVFLQDSHCG